MSCVASPDEDVGPSEAARELGIASIERTETDKHVSIVGRSAGGEVLASLELSIGTFEFRFEERGEVYGRQLAIDVLGKQVFHESEGTFVLKLPLANRDGATNAFLLDPLVTEALARRGVMFDATGARVGGAESPYWEEGQCGPTEFYEVVSSAPYGGGGTCGAFPRCGGSSNNECVAWDMGTGVFGEFVCCFDTDIFAERTCKAGSSSFCGPHGNNPGCAVCWNAPFLYDACDVWASPPYGIAGAQYCPGQL